jgi:F0F1-type ATP synthase epsilon subunit
MHVTLLQGNRLIFRGVAAQVVLPGAAGELSVFDHHAPLLCALQQGSVQVDERVYAVGPGLACMARNRLTIVST